VDTIRAAERADLTDAQWAVLKPLLPKGKKAGRPPKWSKRQLIDGIRWRVRVGGTVAGRAGPLWAVAVGLWAVSALATRRDLAADLDGVAGTCGCGRVDHLGRQRGRHHRAGAPACGRRRKR
jgi:hypothetical protein